MIRLSDWELDLLPLSLITTKKEAETILKRNDDLLDAHKSDVNYAGKVGCPHCKAERVHGSGFPMYRYQCADSECKWDTVITPYGGDPICCYAPFNGVTLQELECVTYGHNDEVYEAGCTDDAEGGTFIAAHILWVGRILDGTYVEYATLKGIKKSKQDIEGKWQPYEGTVGDGIIP